MRRILTILVLALALVAAIVAVASLIGGPRGERDRAREATGPADEADSRAERQLARARAAAWFERGDLARARAALEPLVSRPDPTVEDLVRAAVIDYAGRADASPSETLERLRAREPEHPALHFMLARIALEEGELESARAHFETALRRAPADAPSRIGLATALEEMERTAEAREVLREVIELGVEEAGGWYVQAVYRAWRIALREGPPDEALRLATLFEQLLDLGYRAATPEELERGELAVVPPPEPGGIEGAQPGDVPRFEAEPPLLEEWSWAERLLARDFDGDGDLDLLVAGERGVALALLGPDETVVETVATEPARLLRVFDLGDDDSLDLVFARGAELVLMEAAEGAALLGLGRDSAASSSTARWHPSPIALPALPAPASDVLLVDFDHEGDLDLVVVGPFGARLFRNDGAAARAGVSGEVVRGAFTDVTAEAGLPVGVALAWCAIEDFDADQDVDLLLGGPDALILMDNLRGGRFVDVTGERFGAGARLAGRPLLSDLDGDARVDLLEPGPGSATWWQRADGSFDRRVGPHGMPEGAAPIALDLDLDGTVDVAWLAEDGSLDGVLGFGLDVAREFTVPWEGATTDPFAFADLDGDLDQDFVRVGARGVGVLRCEGPSGNAVRVRPLGLKDNRHAVGAVVEARTRGLYRRIFWRGASELVGCGPHESIDVLRITWPNGVVQTRLDVGAGDRAGQGPLLDTEPGSVEQTEGLIGSCPFLYAWNGSTFEFITDVLGVTPLGLPMVPGSLVPPDHDEYVLVRGDQLVPREGWLELQLTEELREVTYLDRVRLDVVDHPSEVEVQPNERFCFPPFPTRHVHSLRAPLSPLSAVDGRGRDWTRELAAVDDVHAVPFEPLEPQLLGLATPHVLELAWDAEATRGAELLRLVCTGWFYWTDASVNVASARTPGVAFVPPTLQVPGPEGSWVDAGPPVGFPAGKSKTMVVDVSDVLDPADPRLRVVSTLRLYWDSIRLAVDEDDAPLRVTSLEPASARLWPRGFSLAAPNERSDLPERFVWDRLEERPRWNPHPGRYTRYGETVPLLGEVDDRFVILGTGDALTLRFDARGLPPLAGGWTRDYLVFLDGWAKDRDPNTLEALEVEPLPFHGMSGYPYGPGESFPSDAAHEAWRAEWNTREARPWIAPLAPHREREWASGPD